MTDRIVLVGPQTVFGKLVPCLFSPGEYDVKPLLRKGAAHSEIATFMHSSFWLKSEVVEDMMKKGVELRHVGPMHTIGE